MESDARRADIISAVGQSPAVFKQRVDIIIMSQVDAALVEDHVMVILKLEGCGEFLLKATDQKIDQEGRFA